MISSVTKVFCIWKCIYLANITEGLPSVIDCCDDMSWHLPWTQCHWWCGFVGWPFFTTWSHLWWSSVMVLLFISTKNTIQFFIEHIRDKPLFKAFVHTLRVYCSRTCFFHCIILSLGDILDLIFCYIKQWSTEKKNCFES